MRKIIVLSFITLDGVMQAPGGPEEDPSGGFKHGGWTYHYMDDFLGNVMEKQINRNFDLLLGRKTYDIFASYWPFIDNEENPIAEKLNKARKYVVTKSMNNPKWENSFLIKDNMIEELRKLKQDEGPDLQIHGSGNLIQTLLNNDLIDEFWLKIFPITLGRGKKLFAEGTLSAGFELIESKISPKGVIIANFKRSGEVKTGTIGSKINET